MNDDVFNIDIFSIANTKKIMDEKCSELLSMINHYKDVVDNTKNIYDTESATLYRKIAFQYIELVQRYLNNDLKLYIDKLDEVREIYFDKYNAINDSVHGRTK